MSVKVMGMVWDCEMSRDMKFVLLAYADHADHEGKNIYPAVATIMRKTGYGERSVQAITKKLIKEKYLLEDGSGPHGTNKFKANLGKICGGAEFAGVQKTTQKSNKRGAKNDTQTAPDPSFKPSSIEPSGNTPDTLSSLDYPRALLNSPFFMVKWREWWDYRKEIKKPLKATTAKKQLAFLETQGRDAVEVLEQSMVNGWTGLFPLKKNGHPPTKPAAPPQYVEEH